VCAVPKGKEREEYLGGDVTLWGGGRRGMRQVGVVVVAGAVCGFKCDRVRPIPSRCALPPTCARSSYADVC
jgi:hypothetical protein